jgi:hypothetical protein
MADSSPPLSELVNQATARVDHQHVAATRLAPAATPSKSLSPLWVVLALMLAAGLWAFQGHRVSAPFEVPNREHDLNVLAADLENWVTRVNQYRHDNGSYPRLLRDLAVLNDGQSSNPPEGLLYQVEGENYTLSAYNAAGHVRYSSVGPSLQLEPHRAP